MTRYAVLLKGINVGGHKKIAMADLRDLLGRLGFGEVSTYLQSGNAVLTSDDPPEQVAAKIEAGIADAFGMQVRALVRTGPQLAAVRAAHPFEAIADNGSRMFALFLSEAPDPALLTAHDPRRLAPGEIELGDRVIYHWCPHGALEAPNVSAWTERHLRVTVTARNWNTVTKLAQILG